MGSQYPLKDGKMMGLLIKQAINRLPPAIRLRTGRPLVSVEEQSKLEQ